MPAPRRSEAASVTDERDGNAYRPLGLSLGIHIALAVVLTMSWVWHTDQQTISPPAMMRAALVSAPKTTVKPQQKNQTQKQEKPKPQQEEPKPEPPKPEVEKPKETKPQVTPTDKPSPIAAKEPVKPEPAKAEPVKQEPKKATPKEQPKKEPAKPEPPKNDAKQAEKAQKALSQVQKEKISKEADMAIQALLENEDVTRMGDLNDDEIGKWVGLIATRVEENWSRPPNARKDMKVVMEIELLPNGQVINVTIVESSGDRSFDLAAEAAVRKADKFEEIATMKPELFDKVFRKFKLLFNPEDLLM
jgi:colicin import membrane protein